jgi:alkylated DNA repair dioxygenase AlkB
VPGCFLSFWPEFIVQPEADRFLDALMGLPWGQNMLTVYGKPVKEPHLAAWVSDPGVILRYAGITMQPTPWTPETLDLRRRVEAAVNYRYRGVLANLYRDGDDSIGWHHDDEQALGDVPVIASLSLGAVRKIRFRWEHDPRQKVEFELPCGSLLLTHGATNEQFKHTVPKTKRVRSPRINLTFRLAVGESSYPDGACE